MLYLQQFNFTFQHCSGKLHGNADALSRVPNPVCSVLHQLATSLDMIRTAQVANGTSSNLMKALSGGGTIPASVAPGFKHAMEFCVGHFSHHHQAVAHPDNDPIKPTEYCFTTTS